jgi:hypothetical protein
MDDSLHSASAPGSRPLTAATTPQSGTPRTTPSLSPPPSPPAGASFSRPPSTTSAAFIRVGFTTSAFVESLLQPLQPERRTNVNDEPGRAEALRAAFCLPPGQALLAHFLCGRRKPGGW